VLYILTFFAMQSIYRIIQIRPLTEGSFVLNGCRIQTWILYI